jgi:hypothetical protein
MFYDRRNSNRCDSETYKNTHMSKVGGRKRKKVQYLINTQIIKNKTTGGGGGGERVAQNQGQKNKSRTRRHQDPIVE